MIYSKFLYRFHCFGAIYICNFLSNDWFMIISLSLKYGCMLYQSENINYRSSLFCSVNFVFSMILFRMCSL